MALQDFADFIPHIAVEDGRALGAGRWEAEAREALSTHGAALLRGPILREDGVEIALEPLHPVYAADRSCLSTIDEALDLCESFDSARSGMLGVCLDVYHIWWDPYLARATDRARGRILGFHVCDWLLKTKDVLNDRGMMGDGVIDIPSIRSMVEGAGYNGLVEVEIFSAADWWTRPIDETLKVCRERMANCC